MFGAVKSVDAGKSFKVELDGSPKGGLLVFAAY